MGTGGWGAGGGSKKKSKPAPRDPEKELFRSLARALVVRQERHDDAGAVRQADDQIQAALRGLRPGAVRRAARHAELPNDAVRALVRQSRSMQPAPPGSGLHPLASAGPEALGSAFNRVMHEASRPVQATTSAVAEWSRQGEENPIQVGPLSLRFGVDDPGAILRSAKEGFEHKRHDSPVTIAMEAGKIRAKQGVGTESFGVVPGTDLRTGQALPGGIAGKMTYDVGGSMVLDPLTYITLGTGSAARQGLSASSRVLGAERAAQIAEGGVGVLSAEEKARLGVDIIRRLRGVKPGIAVRVPQPIRAVRRGENLLAPPRTVISAGPLVRGATRGAHAVADTKVGGLVERAFVPRAGVKQAERAGRLAPGTADDLDRMRVAFASGSDASQDLQYLAWVKRTHKLSDDETEALMRALETSPDGLSPKVRGAYDGIDEYRRALAEEKRAAGVISSTDEVQAKREAGVAGKYAPQHTRAEKALNRVLVKLRAQQERVDDATRRLEAAKAEAEFVDVPAVNRPAGMGPSHHVRDDQVLVRKVGEARTALAREQTKLRVLANTAKSAENRALAIVGREQRALARLPGAIPDEQYVPHIEVDTARAREAEKRAQIMGGGGASVTSGPAGFTRRREIQDTVFGANARGQSFETDPFLAFARHAPEARREIATRRFIDDALALTDSENIPLLRRAEDLPDMTDDALKEAGLVKVEIHKQGEFVVDKALAPEIRKFARLSAGDETTNAFLRGVDRWMTLWKGYATVPLPFGVGFHMRNGTSNVMLNWLADINPVDPAYVQAWRMQRAISKGMKEGDALRYLTGTQREVAAAALDRDVIGGAFFIEDIPPDLMRPFKSRAARIGEAVNPLDPGNLLIRGGRRVGIEIEENARLAHFIAKYREYHNFDDAASSVRKYLFDYGDLTPFEKDVMKRVIPFYTFTRKNTPLWIAAAFKQPGKYSRLAEWQHAFIDAAGGYPDGPIPQYLEDQGAVPVPGVQVGGNPVLLSPDLPPIAASEVVTPALQLAALVPGAEKLGLKKNPEGIGATVRPLFAQTGGGLPGSLKALYDAFVAERDSFTGRPFYEGERVEAPIYLDPLAPLGIHNPLLPKREVDGEQVPSITRRNQYLIEALMPMLPKMRSLAPTSPQDEDKQLRRGLSILTGVQAYPLGEATQRSELFRRVEILRRYLADLEAQGVEVPVAPPTRKKSTGW